MTTSTKPPIPPTSNKLQKMSPGMYVDEAGKQYFYMAGLYPHLAKYMMEEPEVYTSTFIVKIVGDIHDVLHSDRTELMD